MKKTKYSVLSLALLLTSVVFTSCNTDDATNDSVVNVNDGAASVVAVSSTIDVNGVSMLNEGDVDSDHKFSVVLDKVQPVDVYVNVSLADGGDAVEGEDFDFDHQIVIPAYTTTGEGTISIHGDGITETTESFTLVVGSGSEANLSLTPKELVFNITDYGDLNLELSWDTPFDFGGSTYTLCEIGYDVDFVLLNAAGEDVTDFEAATGDCPEHMTLSLSNLSDGEYTLVETIYDDAGLSTAAITPAFAIPVTVGYTRDNSSFTGSFTQDAADAVDSDHGSDPSGTIYVATVTIANGTFTFSKNGTFVASGRMNKIQKMLKNRKAKAAKANFFQGLK